MTPPWERRPSTWLGAVLLFAAVARLVDLDWDQGHAFHPDERAIAFAVQRLSFHPWQLNPGFFAYGSLPFYVIRILTGLFGLVRPELATDFDFVLLTGRATSAAAGVLTVLLLFRLGARLYGQEVGLLAATLLAACVLHIQCSRFMTTDVVLTLLVLLALERCLAVLGQGRTRDFLSAGAVIGLALATKVSAAPLFAPFALAALLRARQDGARRMVVRMGAGLVATAAAFALGEPYALLGRADFWHQLREQADMVRHAGSLPYTIQYVGVRNYLYEITQMVLWGMAPLLGLAALWGTATRIGRALREPRAEEWVLAAWVATYFLITGSFEVKFLRYLLPIYPVLILWGAAWLWDRARAGGSARWPLWIVTGGTVTAAFCFLSVYRGPHTAVAASQWVYRNVAPGSVIVTQHWDEGFPLPLPGGNPEQYTVSPFPYYEPDRPEKIHALSQELAGAQFVALPTRRIYGAVTRAPERFPLTNNYFRLLFAGDLGYALVHEEARRPRLLGMEVPDELADESFSVYDHPKVLIFANEGHFSSDRLYERISEGVPSRALDRTDLLLAHMDTGGKGILASSSPPVRSSVIGLLRFAVVVELLGLAAFSLLRRRLPRVGGYALAKVIGVILYAFVCWWTAHLVRGGFTRPVLTGVFLALVGWGLRSGWRGRPRGVPPEWRLGELLFWGSFLFFALLRAWNPAIFWGEKPMDFAFLNTLTRATTLPPPEPWFAGSRLHYGYFGHFMVAALGKLCHLHPGLTFNLGIALTGALTATSAFALGQAISGRWRTGLLAAGFTTLLGNLSGPVLLLKGRPIDFDYFWATSRVIENTINEYPLWSLLFADLHAHVLAMPIALAYLTFVVWWVRRGRARSPTTLGLMGLTLGAIAVTSTWSVPTYALLLPVLLTGAVIAEPARGRWATIGARVVWPILLVPAAAWLLYLPFWRNHRAPERAWGWERETFASIDGYVQIFGLFLAIGVAFLLARFWRDLSSDGRSQLPARLRFGLLVALISACLALSLVGRSGGGSTHAGWLRIGLIGLGLLGLHLGTRPSLARSERLASLLLAWAFFVTAGCDVVYVWDRMNTVFKFYLDAWLLFATAAAVALSRLGRPRGLGLAGRAVVVILAAASLFTAATCVYAVLRTERVATRRPTLDGTAYLAERNPEEARAIEWLNGNLSGTPVIAEAWGPAYGDSARISMNTGLPTVIGWEYHVFQRGQAWPEIHAREADVEALYTSLDKDVVTRILDRYAIAFVFVGDLERRTYGAQTTERLAAWTDLLTPVYRDGAVTVFGVKGRLVASGAPEVEEAAPSPAPSSPATAAIAPPPLGQLSQPRGLDVDRDGNLYVADFDHHRIQKIGPDGRPLAAWGGPGHGPGRFEQPCQVAVGGDEVYVADTWNNRVQVFDRDGHHLREWSGDFYGPRGIAVAGNGRVYVADTGNHRVRSFSADGRPGASWGGRGSEPGQFVEPIGIATDARGAVYVCDNGNARLQAFTGDGTFLRAFPVPGWRTETFSEPKLTLTPSGVIWVTVPLENVVRAYDGGGKLLREISGGSIPEAPFAKPMGIAYNPVAKELVIADLEGRLARIPLAPKER